MYMIKNHVELEENLLNEENWIWPLLYPEASEKSLHCFMIVFKRSYGGDCLSTENSRKSQVWWL